MPAEEQTAAVKAASSTDVTLRDMAFFLKFGRARWREAVLGFLLTVAAAGFGSLLPLGGKAIIDFVVFREGIQKVEHFLRWAGLGAAAPLAARLLSSENTVVLMVMCLGAGMALASLLQKLLMFRFQQEITKNLQIALFDHVLRFPLSYFRSKQTGYLMSRVLDDVQVVQYAFSEAIPLVLWRALFLIFGLGLVYTLNSVLALVSLGLLPLAWLVTSRLGGLLRDISRAEREQGAEVSREIQEVFSGVETVKAHAAEGRQVERVTERIGAVVSLRIRAFAVSLLTGHSVSGFQFAYILAVMWFGAREILQGRMTVGDYVALTSYAVYFSGAVNTIAAAHVAFQPSLASMGRLKELFSLLPEASSAPPEPGLGPLRGEVSFDRVSFAYDAGRDVLTELTFSVPPGEITAIEGPSGAGKTTLVNLLLKFYRPSAGSILLDGRDIQELPTRWLRSRIGVVSQDVFLFNDTIANNIRYGNPAASDAEVHAAAEKAGIHRDITAFAKGYATMVGERGLQLSAGQRQRISIARAFLRDPALLILDEPTSALDAGTEALLTDSIAALARGRTTFIITHRPALSEIAGTVMVIEAGRIREIRRKEARSSD